jgi:hypothetical protein
LSYFSQGTSLDRYKSAKITQSGERNIRAKLGSDALVGFYQHLASIPLELAKDPTQEEISVQSQIIATKDAQVLASAIGAGVDVLLTPRSEALFLPESQGSRLALVHDDPGRFPAHVGAHCRNRQGAIRSDPSSARPQKNRK